MCGVAGLLSGSTAIKPDLIHQMAQPLSHRGPDGYDVYQEDFFQSSHNLLSLFSQKTKPGPYISQNQQWVLSFNGEIYNHQDLKKELEKKYNIHWSQHTDAEILLEGWSFEGQDFLKKINGMFAFSIWDRLSKTLFLANDTLAEKILYYTLHNQQLYFSSEIKSFLAIGIPLQINHEKIEEYFSYRYVSAHQTLFKNIFKLNPGEILEISQNLKIKSKTYTPQNLSVLDASLESLIESSVNLRTSPNLQNSIFLSSGLDSQLLAHLLPENSLAITLTSDPTVDLKTILQTCKDRSFQHVQVQHPHDISDLLDECLLATEEPIGDSIQISNMILAKSAKQNGAKIVFTGDGADEVFAGYIHHLAYKILSDLKRLLGLTGLKLTYFLLNQTPSQLISILTPYSQNLGHESKMRLLQILKKLIEQKNYVTEMTQLFKMESSESESKIQNFHDLLKHDLKHWLPNYVLMRNDKILMSQGIEGRHPYLDCRIINHVLTFTADQIINGFERKSLLKKVSRNYLSPSISNQKKKSFVINYDLNSLIDKNPIESNLIKEFLKKHPIDFKSQDFVSRKKIFSILVFQRWLKLFQLES